MLESWARQELPNSTAATVKPATEGQRSPSLPGLLVSLNTPIVLAFRRGFCRRNFAKCILHHSCVQTGFRDPCFSCTVLTAHFPGTCNPTFYLMTQSLAGHSAREAVIHRPGPLILALQPSCFWFRKPHSKYIGLSQELSVSGQMFSSLFCNTPASMKIKLLLAAGLGSSPSASL